MWVLLLLATLFAIMEATALYKEWRPLEYAAKPAVMICLFAWLYLATALDGAALWFGIGVLFSLAGDLLLLQPGRFFVYGLAAFLLAHTAYILGFNSPPAGISFWSLALAVVVGMGAARLLRRILAAIRDKGQNHLAAPVALYGGAVTLMLLSALLTLPDSSWHAGASLLVSTGALAFFLSDVILAWNMFVAPIKNGRLLNIMLYHAGQIALIGGVVLQFSQYS